MDKAEKINVYRKLRDETKRADNNYVAYDRMRQKYRLVALKYREIRGLLKDVRAKVNTTLPDYKLDENGYVETIWPEKRDDDKEKETG